jgi:hypothetical protein
MSLEPILPIPLPGVCQVALRAQASKKHHSDGGVLAACSTGPRPRRWRVQRNSQGPMVSIPDPGAGKKLTGVGCHSTEHDYRAVERVHSRRVVSARTRRCA